MTERRPDVSVPSAQPTLTQPVRRVPIRTCVACRTSGGKRGLLRVVRLAGKANEAAVLALDPTGKKSGRGAYVCPTAPCVETALKRKALERSLKTPVPETVVEALRAAIEATGNLAPP